MPFRAKGATRVLLAPACGEPWIVTRVYEHLSRSESTPEMVLLAVPPGYDWVRQVLERAFSLKYRWVEVEGVELRGPTELWLEIICGALGAVNPDLVSVLVSCSTPELAALLTSIAQLVPLEGVYAVSMKASGRSLERWRKALSSQDKVEDPILREIFWPERDDYEVHKLPILPMPPTTLESVERVLSGRYDRVDGELAAWLIRAGLVDIGPARDVKATGLGRAILGGILALRRVGSQGEPVLNWG
ncbi:MAG: hypothetical protein QI223_05095 [Candidatus Korarchaeota archaeon]|nr:hypothetical protein [Candidatus Korarchaeota archaeon]